MIGGRSTYADEKRELNRRARHGIRFLVGRQAVLQLLAIGGGIVAARVLGPGPLGVYGIALFILAVASLLTELGLKTALIRHAGPLTERHLATSFTLQQVLASVLAALLFIGAPALTAVYRQAGPDLAWMVRLLAFDLYLQSWRTVSEVCLERELHYGKLAVADVVGSVGYQTVSISLLLSGWGVESLVYGLLTSSFLRTAFVYCAAPWPMRLALHPPAVRELLRTGVPLQASRIIDLAPSWITPTLVAALIGPEAVGLVIWASTLGRKPVELLQNVVRVSLPQFARLHDDLAEVERVLSRYVFGSLLATGLWLAVLLVTGRDLVTLVYTERWLPAMPALLLYAGVGMLASVRWLAVAALIGIGRVHFNAKVSMVVAAVAVATSTVLVLRLGFVGVPLGQLTAIALAAPWLLRGLRPTTQRRILRDALPVLVPMAAAVVIGEVVVVTLAPIAAAIRALVTAATMAVVYAAASWWTGPDWLRASLREEIALPAQWVGRSAPP